jgi:hypothetical protein
MAGYSVLNKQIDVGIIQFVKLAHGDMLVFYFYEQRWLEKLIQLSTTKPIMNTVLKYALYKRIEY